nr:c-type cytochrome [uncultured Sphingomonas sp.]
MIAPAIGIGFELPLQVATIQPRQPRRPCAIAAPVEPVAGEAGIGGSRTGTAVRDHAPILGEAIERRGVRRRTTCQKSRRGRDKELAHGVATVGLARWFPLTLLALAACKPPPDQRHFVAIADPAHGKAVMERVGCGSCHAVPGVRWPQGKVGPALDGLAERALIAGKLPNEPDLLAAYIRNAPALVPGSGMPAMPVTEAEARDIAAYLYEQGAD